MSTEGGSSRERVASIISNVVEDLTANVESIVLEEKNDVPAVILMQPLTAAPDANIEMPESQSGDSVDKKVNLIAVHLRSVGEAPSLKKKKLNIDGSKTIGEINKFLRKVLKHDGALFLYCNSGFSPTPDQRLQDLFDSHDEVVINYGYQEAWG